jgi:hypothetical protein
LTDEDVDVERPEVEVGVDEDDVDTIPPASTNEARTAERMNRQRRRELRDR